MHAVSAFAVGSCYPTPHGVDHCSQFCLSVGSDVPLSMQLWSTLCNRVMIYHALICTELMYAHMWLSSPNCVLYLSGLDSRSLQPSFVTKI